jgi:intracellular multiplication protein IcmB
MLKFFEDLYQAIVRFVESIAYFLGRIFRTSATTYVDLETSNSKFSLVTKQGGLVSAIRIRGRMEAVGLDEYEASVEALSRAFSPFLENQGHSIHVYAECNPDGASRKIAEAQAGARRTAKSLGLTIEDVFDAREDYLAAFTADEDIMVSLWSLPIALSAQDLKREKAAYAKKLAALEKTTAIRQNLFAAIPDLVSKHDAFVAAIFSELEQANFLVEKIDAHEMLREARARIDPEFTSPDYKPCLPGDPIPAIYRTPENLRKLDFGDVMYPPISMQMFPRDLERIGTRYLRSGQWVYAPLSIEIPPREITAFSDLFMKLCDAKVPWRVNFTIDGGGLKFKRLNNGFASLLAFTGGYNKNIRESVKYMEALARDNHSNVRLKINLCTWAPVGPTEEPNLDLLRQRAERLAQSVTAWGSAEVREIAGDPMDGFMSTVPFLRYETAGEAAIAPVEDVARLLPFMRPASPFPRGGVLFRTKDGKLMPFEPGDSLQSTWGYLIFGQPGQGKSVLMSSLLFAVFSKAGSMRIPRIAIIDIGPSSKGFINLVRDSLPKDLRHLATHVKLRMTDEYRINPFDTQLGCRAPTPEHMSFLVNYMTAIATAPEMDRPHESMSQLVASALEITYKELADDNKATRCKRYNANVSPIVDEALARFQFEADGLTRWWNVVDFLFEKHAYREAMIAQRYAVPVLGDLISSALNTTIADLYEDVKLPTSESLNDHFNRMMSAASAEFPIFSGPTQFDIGDAKIASIDIGDVAPKGSANANRKTALMYLLAKHTLTKDYRLTQDHVNDMPPKYRRYHAERIAEIFEDFKWVVWDEVHRTAAAPAVLDEIEVDLREGRKWNMGTIMASQRLEDFNERIRAQSTGVFIMAQGQKEELDNWQKIFGFNNTARALIKKEIRKPTHYGAPFFAILKTAQGFYSQLMYSTISPVEAWAYDTTVENVLVRDAVTQRLGSARARQILAMVFPSPNACKEEVEKMRQAGSLSDDTSQIEMIVRRVLSFADEIDGAYSRRAA